MLASLGPVEEELEPGDEDARPAQEPPARSWIHPSELPNFQGEPLPLPIRKAPKTGSAKVLRIAAVSITVGLIGGVAFAAIGRHPSQPVLTSATSVAAAPRTIQAAASALVSLRISSSAMPSSLATGLVVDQGTLVATTAIIPSGGRVMVSSAGQDAVSSVVVASDPISGLTLLRPSTALRAPAATVASPSNPEPATEVWVSSTSGGALTIKWASTSLASLDAPIVVQTVGLGTMTDTSSSSTMAGAVLVSRDGTMLGISAPQLGLHSWLPLAFVEELAATMPSSERHGCLRITAKTAAGGGVKVVSVDSDSPALHSLEPGDVLLAVDGQHLSSISQLLDLLYTRDPGSSVTLTYQRHGAVATADVVLASST